MCRQSFGRRKPPEGNRNLKTGATLRYTTHCMPRIIIKLVSTADTGYFYTTTKNPKTKTEKINIKKFDPVVRKHVIFKEAKA